MRGIPAQVRRVLVGTKPAEGRPPSEPPRLCLANSTGNIFRAPPHMLGPETHPGGRVRRSAQGKGRRAIVAWVVVTRFDGFGGDTSTARVLRRPHMVHPAMRDASEASLTFQRPPGTQAERTVSIATLGTFCVYVSFGVSNTVTFRQFARKIHRSDLYSQRFQEDLLAHRPVWRQLASHEPIKTHRRFVKTESRHRNHKRVLYRYKKTLLIPQMDFFFWEPG